MFKKKEKHVTTMFDDLPIDEFRCKMVEIKDYIYKIVESDKFIDIATKIPVPVNATSKDIDDLMKKYAPKKIKSIIELLFEDNFEDFMRIGATLFCEDYNIFIKKSLSQIVAQFESLKASQIGVIIQLFTHAGR